MAYPFMKFPTFAEFIEKLRSAHNIVLKDLDETIIKDEAHLAIHYLEGVVDGKEVRCVIDIVDFAERVTPSVLRSVCARFGGLNQESFASTEATTVDDTSGEQAQS